MKIFCAIIGIICLANGSSGQYSYVYEIRHDNKQPPKSEMFGDLSQYKHNNPSQLSRSESSHRPKNNNDIRDFSVRSPEMGPTILNLIRNQLGEKSLEPNGRPWQSPQDMRSNSLVYESNTNGPQYSLSSPQKMYGQQNQLPIYSEKHATSHSKGYPSLDYSRPSLVRDEPSYGGKNQERIPIIQTSYKSQPHQQYQQLAQNEDNSRQTVHQIKTPNYRIQLLSEPEPLDKILPLLQQQQHLQSLQKPNLVNTYASQPMHSQQYSEIPRHQQQPQSQPKPYILSTEPYSRAPQPLQHTFNQVPEEPIHQSRPQPIHRPIQEVQYLQSQPLQRYEDQQQPQHLPQHLSQPLPQPILELPKQQLPPQLNHMTRPIQQYSAPQYLPPPQPLPRHHHVLERQPQPPAQGLYQMASPDLSSLRPQKDIETPYSRVEYIRSDDGLGASGQQSGEYSDEPVVQYEVVERPQKVDYNVGLKELTEKLELNPSAQKLLFDALKSQSVELSPRDQINYSKGGPQTLIATDPNYKSPPIPQEYKPYTQTRYYKVDI